MHTSCVAATYIVVGSPLATQRFGGNFPGKSTRPIRNAQPLGEWVILFY
jgi:hypothetical protein